MRKETIERHQKVWGSEKWLVNSDKYCGKLLLIDKGAESSYHYHPVKEETFFCLGGLVELTVNGKKFLLDETSNPITIEPFDKHSFRGVMQSVLLEASTPHDEVDVVRLSESHAGVE